MIEEDLSGPESCRGSIGFVWASFAGDQLDVDFPSGLFYRIKRGVLHDRGDYGTQSDSFQDHTPWPRCGDPRQISNWFPRDEGRPAATAVSFLSPEVFVWI
jgi:hypothetical protein